jgi:uncharacterized cupredoxin-like copper-binding protein
VVTNALRLRRFQPPASAAQILHPSLRSRVAEYTYLVAIAAVALGVGLAALSLARGEQPNTRPISRVVALSTDGLRFTPDALNVRAGETIAFEITNPGSVAHEFFIGDAAAQAEHEAEMARGMPMHGEPGQVDIPAGRTARLVYTFDQPGTLEFACHLAGHYPAGMRGTITVSGAA